MDNKVKKLLSNTKFDAHRGDSWMYPENSKQAIISAFNNKDADTVEFDVRMTKDNKLVIRHDNFLFLTTKSFKKVSQMTLEELKSLKATTNKIDYFLDYFKALLENEEKFSNRKFELFKDLLGLKGEILTLEELLNLAPKSQKLLLEVKGNDEYYKNDFFSKGILELVNEYSYKNIHIHGYDEKMMLKIRDNIKNNTVGIGVKHDLDVLNLPFNYACFSLDKIKNDIPTIINLLEKNQINELHLCKVDSKKELEIYKLFLEAISKSNLTPQISVMSNDVTGAKMLIKKEID